LADAEQGEVLWVPALWWYELGNALTVAVRRKRLSEADATRFIDLYSQVPLQTDTHLTSETVWRLRALAQEHHLSAYDAAYLELAQRRGLGLATLDKNLIAAARRAGVQPF
jgi:predicted nucleic acid-binding protein